MPNQPQLDAFFRLIGMLETAIFNGSTGESGKEFYTIPHPGVFVSPGLKETANSKDMSIISSLFNTCFESTLLYQPNLSTVSQVYQDVLEQAALPEKRLTKKEEDELKEYEEFLDKTVEIYLRYKSRAGEISGEIIRQQILRAPADVLAALQIKLEAAEAEWIRFGKREQYEEKQALASYLRSVSPRLFFQRLLARFNKSTQTTGAESYQATYLSPPVEEWTSPYAGWSLFDKTFKYSELHTRSKHSTWSGSAGGNFGLWRAKGGASGSHTERYQASENIDIQLKFEYMRVRIIRHWLVPDVFNYRFWTYKKAFGFREVSDGAILGNMIGPQGLMPVLPTYVVVARNVSISAAFSDEEKRFVEDTLSGSASGGYGPFSVKGSYSSTTTQEDVVGSFDGTTLKIANPQIIAFMGTLMPRSPNPDKRLPWTDDADFGDEAIHTASSKEDFLNMVKARSEAFRDVIKG